jgi:hypothetical protein
MPDMNHLEAIASELIENFEINSPPVPIESMLQYPRPDMWREVDINQLSSSFISVREHYSPRMSLARLLARHVVTSPWGNQRGLSDLRNDDGLLRAFARMLIMPVGMVKALSSGARTPTAMSMHFEVPEEDARQRLEELADHL